MIYNFLIRGISKLIAVYDPLRAARYLQQHNYLQNSTERGYLAAKKTGADAAWRVTQSSGAQENIQAWQAVTNKTRDLARNNPYIVGARRRFRSNLVSEGIWPRPKILKPSAKNKFDLIPELNLDILARWESWAPTAGANGDSLYQLQRVAANHLFDDGQFIVRKIMSKKNGLKLQIIECDHLDANRDRDKSNNQNRIAGGIELDEYNKPFAYWLLPVHPSEGTSTSVRVPAEEIIHVFDRQRASDVSGICSYASVVQSTFRVNEYAYSTMDTARLSNYFGIWIESPYVDELGQVTAVGTETTAAGTAQRHQKINPAGFHYGLPGEKPHLMRPENPGSQYGPFMTKELQTVSVGAGVGYEAVSHDGAQSNFASSRALLIIERGYTKINQAIFDEQLHSKIYEWFIDYERDFAKNRLNMPNYENEKQRYLRVKFSRPVQEWVDPWKDTAARGERIRLRLSTETDEAEDNGKDIEEIYATIAYEQDLRKRYGIEPVEDPLLESESQSEEDAPPATGNMPQSGESEGIEKWL